MASRRNGRRGARPTLRAGLSDDLLTLLGTAAGDVKVRLEPFEELEIDLSHLWTEGVGDGSEG